MSKNPSLSQQIEQAIKADIISGRLRFGQKISIQELRATYQISSTPVRDAIKSLEVQGFLDVLPRESIRVATMDKKNFKEIFDLRIALECLAVELATPNIPEEKINETIKLYRSAMMEYQESNNIDQLSKVDFVVHQLILDYCGNRRLIQMAQSLSDLSEWARSIVVRQPHSMEFALPEHLQVLYAIRQRNVSDAQEAMRSHLKNAFRRTVDVL